MPRALTALALALAANAALAAETPPHRIGLFPQEVAVRHNPAPELGLAGVDALHLHADGAPVASGGGVALRLADGAWQPAESAPPGGARAVHAIQGDLVFATDNGVRRQRGGNLSSVGLGNLRVHDIAIGKGGRIAAATADGLYEQRPDGAFEKVAVADGLGRQWAAADVLAVAYDSNGQLWFGQRAGVGVRESDGWRFFTGADGLPWANFTCAAAGPDGEVWFGTDLGAVRFAAGGWAYRQGPRWLPGDLVRGIAVDAAGTAWFATDGGIGAIERRPMTLAQKARHYEEEIDQYIKRTPFGYTSEVRLGAPGDRSEIQYTDSDNDGLWTAMFGASQAYAYAVTKSEDHKRRATEAFEALRFLQKVTQGGDHSPPLGYVARTILPGDGPDPNIGRMESDIRHRETRDSLWKLYEPRWPKSADGQWYWKSDTSSDELDGHYYFYPLYHDLVAETEEEKERAREVVRDLTDHLIDHGFVLMEHDGTPTRWSIYNPENLNHSKYWWSERGLKSLSMLSYLAVAEHMTGDAKYAEAARTLREQHAYHTNAMIAKVQYGIGSGNQSDDEMAIMCYYNLLKYTKDEALLEEMRYSFYTYWILMQPEMNPFFNFAYARFGIGATYTNPWGTHPIGPWPGWLDDAMATLTGFPLDRASWPHKNSHRLDLVRLPRQSAVEPYETPETGRGHRVNGKVLPVENRHFNHWNTDPWRLDYGGDGRTLASGTVYLLPYYMGRHHGFIEETAE